MKNNFQDDLKFYILRLIITIIFGIISGIAVYSSAVKNDDEKAVWYFVTVSAVIIIIAVIVFLVRYFRLKKFYND